MTTYADVIIAGGGPAGSTCAWKLQKKGFDCIILDKQKFPRPKPCGGWLMPEVFNDLEIQADEYQHSLMAFERYNVHFKSFSLNLKSLQFAIRREEFDNWLIERSSAQLINHKVSDIRQEGGFYIIDDQYKCRYLVGAGGTYCPVYKTFFKSVTLRSRKLQAVTMVEEFAHDCNSEDLHLWFSMNLLPGYAWYVPKGKGIFNVGIGSLTPRLQSNNNSLKTEWSQLIKKLADLSLVNDYQFNPKGYVYYLRGNVDIVRRDNAFLVGDAAGLATRDMAEGIGPAIKSGLLAAAAISEGTEYNLQAINKYSSGKKLLNRFTEFFITD
jgi:geranylgeranyl reductase family protein